MDFIMWMEKHCDIEEFDDLSIAAQWRDHCADEVDRAFEEVRDLGMKGEGGIE